jgi:3-hydroxyisobutyrate dehydrogenase
LNLGLDACQSTARTIHPQEADVNIGIAGTGRMGAAMAARLLEKGHEVTVWNRTAEKTRGAAAAGAKVAATPAGLAAHSEVVISVLTHAAAIAAAYRGPDGLLSGPVAGKLFIDMSTVRPETERALSAQVREKGAALIDCPVGGTVGPAREGKLLGFVGGEPGDVARARPLLEQLCRRVEHVGPVGAGASMKLAINLPLLVFWQAFGEALSMCAPLGLDPARMVEIFADSSGGPNMLKTRGPAIAAALSGKDVPTTFDVDSIRKDLRTMMEEAEGLGVSVPLVSRTLACFDEAARAGLGAGDGAMLPAHWLKAGGKRKPQ